MTGNGQLTGALTKFGITEVNDFLRDPYLKYVCSTLAHPSKI